VTRERGGKEVEGFGRKRRRNSRKVQRV